MNSLVGYNNGNVMKALKQFCNAPTISLILHTYTQYPYHVDNELMKDSCLGSLSIF